MPVERRARARRSLTDAASRRFAATRAGRAVAELRMRRVPLHWTNMFGAASLASLAVLFVTGILLMFVYAPSSERVVYHGPWMPLEGITVSKAYASTMAISFEAPGGLLLRQLHHWAALLLPATLILQILVSFFTGAFRRPRRGAWVALYLLFIAVLADGWSGYALPDDMLGGTGLRIVQGIVLAIPFVGVQLSTLLFGGEFPGQIIEHLYPVHVAIVPVALLVLIWVRARAAYRVQPPQFTGPGRTEDDIVGVAWPAAAARSGGLAAMVAGLLVLIASTVAVAPIWDYGPSSPGDASAGSQPDWYTGFLDGALRLVPPGWEFVWLHRTWPLALLVPVAVTGAFLLAGFIYPFFEEWVTGDPRPHNLLDRPRNAPIRTAIGIAALLFYGVLWGAAGADIVAVQFGLALESVIAFFQVAVFLAPIVGFEIARRVCMALQRKDRGILLHGYESGRIVRLPGGEYIEVHSAVPAEDRWRHEGPAASHPYLARPDEHGQLRAVVRVRAALSRLFFEERLEPIPTSVLDEPTVATLDAVASETADRVSHPATVSGQHF
ncbi:cytochrome b [Microbacterium sp. ASV49]|uniref:Cytochrome bc1 complex cytochrome b subunit n=1 Tax=Microbacterium candidum TaxID=3041922 RepID=A0ABT7N044_9MICO|nr:cytochrome b N-terminal domain-containing protein [Microbacterium sp. ASV49]MDL9980067.1 cytochrome b N-terminal domain-containing protein [Microbacterium sp. ASV49]